MTAYLSLAAFAAVMIFTPGVNNVLAARAGATTALRAALPLLGGLCLGVPVAVVAAVEALQAIAADPAVRSWLRAASTVYLLYLAIHIARAAPPTLGPQAPPRGSGWVKGLGISLTNPKTWAAAHTSVPSARLQATADRTGAGPGAERIDMPGSPGYGERKPG